MKYDYFEHVKQDTLRWLQDNSVEVPGENLEDMLWADDSVTGNGANGYASDEECGRYLSQNLNLVFQALKEFEVEIRNIPVSRTNIYLDALVRLYLLPQVIYEITGE